MELRHLTYFAVLAEELHFGRAAARLHMAQPPLSQRIRDLERELGVQLFDRSRHHVALTEAGALLLEHVRPVLDGVRDAREAMRRIRPGAGGVLRVGIPPDTRPSTLPALVDGFASRVPDVLLDLQELTTVEQLARLRSGGLDAGIIRHPADTSGLECGPVAARELGVLLPAGHPGAGRAALRLRELDGAPLIIFPREMAPELYDGMLAECRDGGFRPGAIRHARNPSLVQGLVLAGRGIHLNEEPPGGPPAGLVWRPLAGAALAWRSSAAWVAGRRDEVTAAFALAAAEGLAAAGHRPV